MPSNSLVLSVIHCKYPTTYVYREEVARDTRCHNEVFNPRCRVLISDVRTDTGPAGRGTFASLLPLWQSAREAEFAMRGLDCLKNSNW